MRRLAALRRAVRLPAPLRSVALAVGLLPCVLLAVLPLRASLRLSVSLLLVGAGLAVLRWAPRHRVAAVILSAVASLRYLWWRSTETLAFDAVPDAILGVLLLATETYGVLVYLGGGWQAAIRKERRPLPLQGPLHLLPTVDVLIPTYNEGIDILRRTLVGASSIEWPRKKVYVLDDGRRPEVETLAAELGCTYLTRADNKGAKAGNLNAALARTDGELVAVFDADHVPVRSFLDATVGFFQADPKVALVQTPHHFYNPDPFGRNLHIAGRAPPEQAWFYHSVLKGSDFWNAAFFCGSCAVLRRVALESVGGIAQETVTEDAHTALRLHAKGWRSVYLDIPQAAGLATERFAFHVAQRIRWARGMIQILRLDNPLRRPGLNLAQRLHYTLAAGHFLFGLPRLVLLLTPAAWLLLGLHPMLATPGDTVVMALPHLVLAAACMAALNGNTRHSFWPEVYETAIAPWIALVAVVTVAAPRRGKFNVTPKGGGADRYRFDVRSALPIAAVLAWCLAGMVAIPWRLASEPEAIGTLSLALAWNLYNTALAAAAVAVCLERPERRSTPRVPAVGQVDVEGTPVVGELVDLGEAGARFRVRTSAPLRERLGLTMRGRWGDRTEVAARPVQVRGGDGAQEVQVAFEGMDASARRGVLRQMFTEPDTWLRDRFLADNPLRAALSVLLAPARALWGWARGGRGAAPRAEGGPMVTFRVRECACGVYSLGDRCPGCGARLDKARSEAPEARPSRLLALAAVASLLLGLAPGVGVDPATAAGLRPPRTRPRTPIPEQTVEGVRAELARISRETRILTWGANPRPIRGERSVWALLSMLDTLPPDQATPGSVPRLREAGEALRLSVRHLGHLDAADVRAELDAVDALLADPGTRGASDGAQEAR